MVARDGVSLYRFGAGEAADANEAANSAAESFKDGRWSKLPVHRRKDALMKSATLVEEHREELALLECLDAGKPTKVSADSLVNLR